jgi:predicted transglutaminase-like cysteine proteinase
LLDLNKMMYSKKVQGLIEPFQKLIWKTKYKDTLMLYDFGRNSTSMLCPINEILNFNDEKTLSKLSDIVMPWTDLDNTIKMRKIIEWIVENIKYKSDLIIHNTPEYWQYPNETLSLKTGDCEDMAILAYFMALQAGIPNWRLQLAVGDCRGGGHCWLQYISPEINDFINADAAYWPNDSINDLTNLNSANNRENYLNIWVAFNKEGIYARHNSAFEKNFITEG